MAYVSLYRKYRPQNFEDVVGQEHVTTTLKNAIAEGRIASGYLFTGTRGTAKTTCARILAKALNCIGKDGKNASPSPEPCGVCGPCLAIAASSFVDVLELDAASHGKVDDVREIVANIKFPPMEGRYKVYIIDEAHQLSRDAMDAFLKTLEEPPDRVLFILATTEVEKLPITIASRCQVFEFKRGSVAQITSRLGKVLADEKVTAEPAAVTLVARAADGSYRDSLSLLEQVLAYKRDNIGPRDVSLVLGTVDEDLLAQTVDLIAASDAAGLFALAGDVLSSGKDVRQFLKSLATRMRDMLFIGVGATATEPGEMDDSASLRLQAALFSPAALLEALQILTDAERETKTNPQHRLILEMSLLRMLRLPMTASAPTEFVAPPTVAVSAPPKPANGVAGAPVPIVTPAEIEDDADDLPGVSDLTDEDDDAPALLPGDDALDNAPLSDDDSAGLFDDSPASDSPALFDDSPLPSLLVTSTEEHDDADDLLQVQSVVAPPPVVAPPISAPVSPDAPPELTRLQKKWSEVVNHMGSRSPAGGAMCRDAKPIAFDGKTFTLEFGNPLFVDKMERKESGRQMLTEVIEKILDSEPGTYKIRCVLKGSPAASAAQTLVKVGQSAPPKARQAVAPEPESALFDEVIAVFGGRVFDDEDAN